MSAPVAHTEEARARRPQRMQPRELAAQALVAGLFLAAAGALAASALEGDVPVADLVLLVLAAALLGRLDFEIGAGFTVPTQLVFVPMLFVLPPAIVPLAVAAALALDRIPDLATRRWHPQRLITVPGDAWYAVGPALVFVLAGVDAPTLGDWPVYVLALAAQFAGDLGSSMLREWLGRGVAPSLQLGVLREVWSVDLLLAPIGLLAALATVHARHAYLLVLPLAALLVIFARDRRERIGQAIALSSAYRGTALLLGDVIEADDEYTGRHSKGVVVLATAIADELRVVDDERRLVEFGAMLHDIGKIAIPNAVLNKPGSLTDEEWQLMRGHTVVGQQMLDLVGGALHEVGVIVRSSHEHFDGRGYPDGLAGEQIPRAARIVVVADAYSAMTTTRPYRAALSPAAASAELRKHAGTQFDPVVVDAALTVLARGLQSPARTTAGRAFGMSVARRPAPPASA